MVGIKKKVVEGTAMQPIALLKRIVHATGCIVKQRNQKEVSVQLPRYCPKLVRQRKDHPQIAQIISIFVFNLRQFVKSADKPGWPYPLFLYRTLLEVSF